MSTILIVNDELNHGSKWEVVIGSQRFHCRNEDEVIELIKTALSEKNIAGEKVDPQFQDEKIYGEGDWGD